MRRALVILFVALVGAWLFLWRDCGRDASLDVPSDVARCTENLRAIYAGLLEYQQRFGHVPEHSGVAFIGALIADGVWENTPENRARLTCPGPLADPVPEGVDYTKLAELTGVDSSYAVRDTAAFPLAKFPSGGAELEPLAACDNGLALNHDGCMNVLYSDGSVRTLTLTALRESGALRPSDESIPIGKGSPVPDLQKLLGD